MARRKTSGGVGHLHDARAELPDGRTLLAGQEFSVTGEPGRFTFHYRYTPDGSLTAYGPVGKQQTQWRSFRAEKVKTIHRKKVGR